MRDEIVVEKRFNGPAESGNGGYTAGLVATALNAERSGAQVTLRKPPPLDAPMEVRDADSGVVVYHQEQLIAEATGATPDGEPAPAVPFDRAVAVSVGYPGFADHPFPTCYVCGPDRSGDGLRIFPGPLPDGSTAAPWWVPEEISPATVWAALDCPGGWAILAPGRPYVLGRITARVDVVPEPGTECVVVGAVSSVEGRKAQLRSALYDSDGALLAQASAVWIAVGDDGEPQSATPTDD